jgi:hypothetical protein
MDPRYQGMLRAIGGQVSPKTKAKRALSMMMRGQAEKEEKEEEEEEVEEEEVDDVDSQDAAICT